MKDEEFEKYFRDITNCMYDCTITKAERRTQMRKILEEIENNAKGEVFFLKLRYTKKRLNHEVRRK
jgi:hypothetical protein